MTPSEVASLVSLVLTILFLSFIMEKWKQIEGFRSYYISESGKVRTKDYNHTGKGKLLVTFKNCYGYLAVNLMQDGQRRRQLVHRLVAMAFKKSTWFPMATVNHMDLNKENNHYSNLEWVTVAENLKHGHRNGAVEYASGEDHYRAILSKIEIIEIKFLLGMGEKGRDIASKFKVSEKYISAIKTGRSRKHESI